MIDVTLHWTEVVLLQRTAAQARMHRHAALTQLADALNSDEVAILSVLSASGGINRVDRAGLHQCPATLAGTVAC